jgi:soluble lytic murein transglycosylase-like protein
MKKLTVAAAAFAAGMLTLVAQSQAEPERDTIRATRKAAAATEKPAGKKNANEADAGSRKNDAEAAQASSHKSTKVADAGLHKRANMAKPTRVAQQTKRHKKGRVKIDLDKPDLDVRATAAIAPRAKPVLKAVARKAVKGLDAVEAEIKSAGAAGYTAIVARYASSNGVPAPLAQAVITIESNFSPNKIGGAGEIGLMQIKPATARLMGYSGAASGLYDPETNIKFGMKYLGMAHQLSGGETCGTILRYNAGHGARRMNPASAAYCSKVKALLGG